jgi:hypothetical protein
MMSFTYDDQHRDFEPNDNEHKQKLKGPVSLSVGIDQPPPIDIIFTERKKEKIVHKIKEKVRNDKRATRKLF